MRAASWRVRAIAGETEALNRPNAATSHRLLVLVPIRLSGIARMWPLPLSLAAVLSLARVCAAV
ncbi:hypothetical protein CR51_07415 [Caballeronia megalochromosomata]|nr:hypothetical protein CR51_07415 [Caballeronia megalochromosomata]